MNEPPLEPSTVSQLQGGDTAVRRRWLSAVDRSRQQPKTPVEADWISRLQLSVEGVVDFSDSACALYTSDASNYRQVPLGVVYPANADDIVAVMEHCAQADLPVLMRGGGTSQNGQCVNQAVVMDCSRFMNRILSINVAERLANVQPGVVCDDLKAAAEVHGLTFGPDPATHSRCTLGGMIGNNSCGPHSMLAGKTVENIVELDVLTVDGCSFTAGPTSPEALEIIIAGNDRRAEIYRELKSIADDYGELIREKFPTIKRRVSGYNLDQLLPENGFNVARALVGTEGTCVSVLGARAQLVANPEFKQLIVLGFEDIFQAGDTVPAIMPFKPIAMEGLDWGIVGGLIERNLRTQEVALLPEGRAWIMMELAAETEELLSEATDKFLHEMQTNESVLSSLAVYSDHQVAQIWSIREQGASATSMSLNPSDPDPIVGWEDTAVDPLQLGNYLREFQALVDRYNYTTSLYGHFGDGCIHARITFDTRSVAGVAKWREFSGEIARLVVKYGGSLSGEHGDGQAKAEFLPIMFGEELMQAFLRFKKVWDPENRMNPGKLIDPYPMDSNLRLGPEYQTPVVSSVMQFREDPGGIGRAMERCIGMGKCRARDGAMCPSFQASGEECYSTRGRAHLLHELMRGEVITRGWDDEKIEDSLAHCLSCKACKTNCPTQVDIAAYKAEFMARHYKTRRRPFSHYAFGHIGSLLPIASKLPGLSNFMLQFSPVTHLLKKILGISAEKKLPRIARESFARQLPALIDELPSRIDDNFYWFGKTDAAPVVVWVDSFNSFYRPDIIKSAIRLLSHQGFRVGVSRQHFCCGRPLYEYGFLEKAILHLDKILDTFFPTLPAGVDVVVLEPSCLSVFHDELGKLRGNDTRAVQLAKQCKTLADFLQLQGIIPVHKLPKGLLHLHCHHKASDVKSVDGAYLESCFEKMIQPEEGCCGMAGAFGVQSRTRGMAKKIFAKKLQPAIEKFDTETIVVTNGFSCNEQFADLAGIETLHPVQIYERCLAGDSD